MQNLVKTKVCRHGTLMYNSNDMYIGKSLDRYGEYSESEIDMFKQLVQPGMTVLDIGANIGTHTVWFGHQVGPAGKVMAFEPQPVAYNMLCGNVSLSNLQNVDCYKAAIGQEPGELEVPLLDQSKGFNFGGVTLRKFSGNSDSQKALVIPIDDFNFSNCNFIKIDIEGMELEALQGALKTITACQPIIYFENGVKEKSKALIEFVLGLGYKLYWHFPLMFNKDNFLQNFDNIFGEMVSINMLALPAGLSHIPVSGAEEVTFSNSDWFPNIKQEAVIIE